MPVAPMPNSPSLGLSSTWLIKSAQTLRGQTYTGTVHLHQMGQIYQISWLTSLGDFAGLGFLEDNHLLAGWCPDQDYGLMLYRISPEGILEGRWTTPMSYAQTHLERATGGTAGQLVGTYAVRGEVRDTHYAGTLTIAETMPDIYHLRWQAERGYEGIGLRVRDWLLASWGYTYPPSVMDYTIEGDRAYGRWVRFQESEIGLETWERIC
ncbi:hypothetical protein OOK60_15470 [Trichothermofontia sichuanensis B231]|uniref:hypothetical protein n=1 Tax=Trichothermofontia sichuanensis TaxID=3045816 RepID=UPI002247CC67|nr:hypothetical protein [Trichothermofontia sichuanensis]UZQ53875.1 hypothetical protein OOK60_15470 [Trichothermofontia sichuanensis B231]